jgi:diadenosine tetraphosphatase ApaH/serine/threonine PP2A family protein phosphatase
MKKERLIGVIGDVHGCYNTLCELYSKLIVHTNEIYTVGDLIDRGSDSKGVIQFCIDNNIKSVMGNHEDMLIKTIRKARHETVPGYETNLSNWVWNGGDKTIHSYLGNDSKSFRKFVDEFRDCGHYDFISKLPLKTELGKCIITHGGIIKNKPLYNVLWNREIPVKLDKIQIIGHTSSKEVNYFPNHYINIDTGCVFSGKLTRIIINDTTRKIVKIISIPIKGIENNYDIFYKIKFSNK